MSESALGPFGRNVLGLTEPQTADDLLAIIGTLRREVEQLDREISSAQVRLKRTQAWRELDDLKLRRKETLVELEDALGASVTYAQPRLV